MKEKEQTTSWFEFKDKYLFPILVSITVAVLLMNGNLFLKLNTTLNDIDKTFSIQMIEETNSRINNDTYLQVAITDIEDGIIEWHDGNDTIILCNRKRIVALETANDVRFGGM
jgi:hypothetical protein